MTEVIDDIVNKYNCKNKVFSEDLLEKFLCEYYEVVPCVGLNKNYIWREVSLRLKDAYSSKKNY